MAKVYSAPEGFDPPEIEVGLPWKEWKKRDQEYIDRLAAHVKETAYTDDPLIGEVIQFSIADGYAQYMVWNTEPLELIHLELGDAWQIPDAHARGIRLADVRTMVALQKKLDTLFGDKE
jgi:hypothetical protein